MKQQRATLNPEEQDPGRTETSEGAGSQRKLVKEAAVKITSLLQSVSVSVSLQFTSVSLNYFYSVHIYIYARTSRSLAKCEVFFLNQQTGN